MLCVDSKVLVKGDKVQKDIPLEDILINHTKHYVDAETAFKDRYVPLDFSVCVRSSYTNKVLGVKNDDNTLYYVNMTGVPEVVHKGYDLVMYMSSLGILHLVNYDREFDAVMSEHSCFNCIGLLNPFPEFMNPIIVSHIIMTDKGFDMLHKFLNPNVVVSDISFVRSHSEGNIKPILDTLVEVKESIK